MDGPEVSFQRSPSPALSPNLPQSRLKTALERWPTHTWVHMTGHGNLSVQRLSRFAFLERRKQAYRYRVLEDGDVVGYFTTSTEVAATLEDAKSPLYNEGLLRKWAEVSPPDQRTRRRASPRLTLRRPASSPAANTIPIGSPPSGPSRPLTLSPREERFDLLVGPNDNQILSPPDGPAIWVTPNTARQEEGLCLSFSHLTFSPSTSRSASPALHRNTSPRWRWTLQRRRADPRQEPGLSRETCTAWQYNDDTLLWTFRDVAIKLAPEPFAEGAMRLVYKAILEQGRWQSQYVAKRYNECTETELVSPTADMYAGMDPDRLVGKDWIMRTIQSQIGPGFELKIAERVLREGQTMSLQEFLTWNRRLTMLRKDMEMQGLCHSLARDFNLQGKGPRVKFLETMVLFVDDRPENNVFACEPMVGAECHDPDTQERAAEEAFSHWTHTRSKGRHLVVNFQRVGDVYVNPQVYSAEQRYGVGDCGPEGIDEFFAVHRCGATCESLGLRPFRAGDSPRR